MDVPQDVPHQLWVEWMRETDPRFQDRRAEPRPGDLFVQRPDGLWMVYRHSADGRCCEITNRNREESPMTYRRGPSGEMIRGR